jgi:hypothetical protein
MIKQIIAAIILTGNIRNGWEKSFCQKDEGDPNSFAKG